MRNKPGSSKLATVVGKILEREGISDGEMAVRCGVSHQTVKNLLSGRSVSAKLVTSIVKEFSVEENPLELRELLIGFLDVQLEEAPGLLERAGIVDD